MELHQNLKTRKLTTLFCVVLLLSALIAPGNAIEQDSGPKTVKVRKGSTSVRLFKPQLEIPENPTDEDIASARVFPERLRPTSSSEALVAENQKLKEAIMAFKAKNNKEDLSDLEHFIGSFPKSRWNPAIQLNMAKLRFETGYFSDALSLYQTAWNTLKNENGSQQSTLANEVLSELMVLSARLGRRDELKTYLQETNGRTLYGSMEEQIDDARTGFKYMETSPQLAYKCGPYALNSILNLKGLTKGRHPVIEQASSTHQGTNLLQLKNWARQCGLDFQIAKRSLGAPVLIPSVVHWKVGHFGALVKNHNGRFQVSDPTFDTDGNFWLSEKALDTECDGYYLVQNGPLPVGWEAVSDSEGSRVWGKGEAKGRDNDEHTPPCPKCYECGKNGGMARATAFKMLATLQIEDTPIEYTPPVGPQMDFTLTYNHLETNQPSSPAFTTFGPDWNFNWLSYLTIDASGNATVRVRGGGSEVFNYTQPNNVSNPYAPNLLSQAILAITDKERYERQLPDGSVEVFDQPDGTGRFFMTKVIDPQGNTVSIQYNTNFRIETITDAIGQATELQYLANQVSNVDYFKVKSISDPFSREATLTYDASKIHIVTITDVISLQSKFLYEPASSFILTMSTPYGITSFQNYVPKSDLNHTDPLATAALAKGIRFTYPDSTAMVVENWLNFAQRSYYWDRHAMELYPGDPSANIYAHCEQTQWQMIYGSTILESSVPDWVKLPLESRITYQYDEQVPHGNLHYTGTSNRPISVSRTITGGATQKSEFQNNAFGRVIQSKDPIGRKKNFYYAANNIDLLEVRQTRGSNNDLLEKWQYNDKHLPLVYIDGSGQTSTFSYNANGQILTFTDQDHKVTTYGYTGNYLTSVDGPLTGDKDKTTLSYDGYGRLYQITDSVGYTLTYDYDAANRVTKTTYPDGTFEELLYDRLDVVASKDRIGRWTTSSYNSLDELVKMTDPLGRSTEYSWCSCGSLVSLTDGAGNKTRWHHDLQGRTIQKIYADQSSYQFEYEDSCSSGRLKRRTDALNQRTDYLYNLDDTLSNINYSNLAVPLSTSNVALTWDQNYERISTITNGWGTLTYAYNSFVTNPYATPIFGGGKLRTVTNNVIANSGIEYFYDKVGRQIKREIDGASNPVTWAYDAMSRVTSEANALGTFNYSYVDQNATGGDRGTTRLAKIDYPSPNNQDTYFSYYGNTGDQRLERISNQASSGSIISQFDYGYDPAGQITEWQQFQNNKKLCYNLDYDSAGQLVSAQAGSGSFSPPFAREHVYSYDFGANRSSVQNSAVETIQISGTKKTGDILTITIFDTGLSGGQKVITYTVGPSDTLASIAQSLVNLINQDSSLQSVGINAVSAGPLGPPCVTIRSVSRNTTTYATSVSFGSTETMKSIVWGNGTSNIIISGAKTAGDVISITVRDATLTQTVSYQVQSTDTLISIAVGLKNAINANSTLTAAGITATSGSSGIDGVLSVSSSSINATNYSLATSANSTESLVLRPNMNNDQRVPISFGIYPSGRDFSIRVFDKSLPGGMQEFNYTTQTSTSSSSIETVLAVLINSNPYMIQSQIYADAGSGVNITSKSINKTSIWAGLPDYSTGVVTWYSIFPERQQGQTITIGGTITTNDTISLDIYSGSPTPRTVNYTVPSGATTTSVAAGLAALMPNAISSSTVVYFLEAPPATVVARLNSGATETVTVGPAIGSERSFCNNANELVGQTTGGPVAVQAAFNRPVSAAEVNSNVILLNCKSPNSTTYSVSASSGTESIALGSNFSGNTTVKIGGTGSSAQTMSLTVHDSRLAGGTKTISISTPGVGISLSATAALLSAAVNSDLELSAIGVGAENNSNASLQDAQHAAGSAQFADSQNELRIKVSSDPNLFTQVIPVTGSSSQKTFTHDANGNLTSDGTNTYEWDAENRLIKISYPGTNNYSQLTYDGTSRLCKIVETVSGTVTETRQIVWSQLAKCEIRDGSGTIVNKLFRFGETVSGANFFFTKDHLGSNREMTNASGGVDSQIGYDPYGRRSLLQGSSLPHFGYEGYYIHSRSSLDIARNRCYSSSIGRFLNRDPIRESGGINLYSFVGNNPINFTDVSGLEPVSPPAGSGFSGLGAALARLCRCCYKNKKDIDACIKQGNTIANNLNSLWNTNYGQGPWSSDPENAGGYMCYDWAQGFIATIGALGSGASMFNASIVEFAAPPEGMIQPLHYAVNIATGANRKCSLMIDDSFLGDGSIHVPPWNTQPYVNTGRNGFSPSLPHAPGSQGPFPPFPALP